MRFVYSIIVLLSLTLAAGVHADVWSATNRLPEDTNALVAVNIDKIMASGVAGTENWADRRLANWAKRPLIVPPDAQRMVMAARVEPQTMQSTWEISLMDMAKMPTVESMAAQTRGYIDRLWNKQAVCAPVNAYFVPLDATTMAGISPAQRQFAARWVRQVVENKVTLGSDYLKKVITGLGPETQMVMAMDLEGAFAVPNIRRALDINAIEGVSADKIDLDEVARILGSIKGLTLTVQFSNMISANLVVDFGRDTAILNPVSKSILISLLDHWGMRIDQVKEWNCLATGQRFTAGGLLSSTSMAKLISLVNSPIPLDTPSEFKAPAGDQPQGDSSELQPIASQRYFKTVTATLDGISEGTSMSESATVVKRATKRIESLPILNVDPELVSWAGEVVIRMRQASMMLATGQLQSNANVLSVATPTGSSSSYSYSTYGWSASGEYYSGPSRADYQNAAQQRRQISLQQKAAVHQQVQQLAGEINAGRIKIRQVMVDRYKIDF